jgi:protein phosphatase
MPPESDEAPSIRTAVLDDSGALPDIEAGASAPRTPPPEHGATPHGGPGPTPAQHADRPPRSVGRYVTVPGRSSTPPPRETPPRRRHVEVRVARCKSCNHELFIGNNFCVECGAPVKL